MLKSSLKYQRPLKTYLIYYFSEKYDLVGKLVKPGEEPRSYSEESDEENATDIDAVENDVAAGQAKDKDE